MRRAAAQRDQPTPQPLTGDPEGGGGGAASTTGLAVVVVVMGE